MAVRVKPIKPSWMNLHPLFKFCFSVLMTEEQMKNTDGSASFEID